MKKTYDSKQQIDEIRTLMERSSRFISLSGLSGVSVGIVAIAGAAIAFFYLDFDVRYFNLDRYFADKLFLWFPKGLSFLILDALAILILAIGFAIFFTTRRAKRKDLKIWTHITRLLLLSLFIPLLTGGAFCLVLLYYKLIFLIAPATLIFYGLSLLNAGKYTLPEIQWLGISETILGLIACLFIGYGLLFWTIGFGLLHIIYGAVMYLKYERENN